MRFVPVTLALAALLAPARLHAQDSTRAAPAAPSARDSGAVGSVAVPTILPSNAGPGAPAAGAAAGSGAGVVQPGMTEAQVRAAWGEPFAVRTLGAHTYMYFRNGCPPARCGMDDVVILERGQVVDAVARASAHRYGGVSSSPAARAPSPTVDSDSGKGRP
jgi:SmpA / OmlA family